MSSWRSRAKLDCLIGSCVAFIRRISIAVLNYLAEIFPEEFGELAVALELMDMAEFMSEQSCVLMTTPNENSIPESQPHHIWPQGGRLAALRRLVWGQAAWVIVRH